MGRQEPAGSSLRQSGRGRLGYMSESPSYEGGCHCGAVRFRVRVECFEAEECNCSVCRKKGYLHLIVPPEHFELLCGEEALATYTFNTGIAKHHFCRDCGVAAFYRPRSHPDHYDVNLRCLDEDLIDRFAILPFDGRHWEQNVGRLRERLPNR
jgi:hypothetical protein